MKELSLFDVDYEDRARTAGDRAIKNAHLNQRILDVLEFAGALNDARMPITDLAMKLLRQANIPPGEDPESHPDGVRILKVAAGIATGDRCTQIGQSHIAEALQYYKFYRL